MLLLSGCETTPNASQLPGKPPCATEQVDEQSRLQEMVTALDGAQGLKEDWLIDYAGRSEKDRLALVCTQDFIKRTWESRSSNNFSGGI